MGVKRLCVAVSRCQAGLCYANALRRLLVLFYPSDSTIDTELDSCLDAGMDKELGLLAQSAAKPMVEGHLCHPSSVTETLKGACQPCV